MRQLILYTLCLLAFNGCSGRATKLNDEKVLIKETDCLCNSANKPDILFTDSNGYSIFVCGGIDEKIEDDKFLISEFTITNCQNKKIIVDNESDGVSKWIFEIYADSVALYSTHYVLQGNDWEYDIIPFTKRVMTFTNEGELLIEEEKVVFTPPVLDKEQLSFIDSLCNELDKKITTPKSYYPFDEKSIYVLFMGAINGHEKSTDLLSDLEKLFELDGAVAETKAEIAFDYVKQKQK